MTLNVARAQSDSSGRAGDSPRVSQIDHSRPQNGHSNGNGTALKAAPTHTNTAGNKANLLPDDAPEYVKKRQGKRGEFRYF
jgi:hypothetical protein